MKGDVQRVKRAAEKVGADVGEKATAKMRTMSDDMIKEGAMPKDLLGVNDNMVEGIYGQAYRLYNTGKYKDAARLFRLLIMLNSTEAKYSMGLAACFHMMKDYTNAIELYTVCGMLDPENPIPHFHASDCYIQVNNKVGALVALQMAVRRAGEKTQFKTLKDRAQMTIEGLRKELGTEGASTQGG